MKNIEIPFVENRSKRYRLFEILPGALSWTILILPFIVSIFNPSLTVFFIIAYLLLWFVKSMGLLIRNFQGLNRLHTFERLDWKQINSDLENLKVSHPGLLPEWHNNHISRLSVAPTRIRPSEVVHALIVATYNESREVLEPTIQSILSSDYDMQKVILVLAYEERGGEQIEVQANQLIRDYGDKFMHAMAVKHPSDIPGEVIGKGGNITYAGYRLKEYVETTSLDVNNIIVTTLDADNRPHRNYLGVLTYVYCVCPDPLYASFQPVPIFTNNIWDAPAPMRVIATGNTFWNVVLSMRPHMIRNFSSHAQGMAALIKTDFWSVRTIVEDGHQFWRTYFRFDGKHEVYPLYIPIYQDAVLSSTFIKTLRAQFVQLRRWAWGASDVAYVAELGYFRKNKIPKIDLTFKFLRLLEGHVSWATAPLILAFASFIPLLFNPQDIAANQLPQIASRIQTVALVGIFATMYLSLKILPPKPARYKRHRRIFMIVQWIFLPVTTIAYNAFAALYSQTRLMFGKYLGKFDVTDKAVITEDKQRII